MKYEYQCPHCDSQLVVCEYIILSLETQGNKKKGLLLLNIGLGDYQYLNHPSIQFKQGETVELFCPVCHSNLKVPEINDNLIRLIYSEPDGRKFDVYFSRVVGEHSTFKIDKNDIIEKFGEDASSYVNYFTAKLKMMMDQS